MSLVFDSATLEAVLGTAIALLAVLVYYEWAFTYWKSRNVPVPIKPKFPFGSLHNIFPNRISLGDRSKQLYDDIKSQRVKHAGFYICSSPKYMPIDPEYIKHILQNDFSNFTKRGFYYNKKDDPLSANLLSLGGDKWKMIHTKLSPAFTPGKLKLMFDNLVQCSNQMLEALDLLYKNKQTVEIRDISESFSVDVIGSCAFGLECNCFKNPTAEFKKQGRRALVFNVLRLTKVLFAFSYPKLSRWLGVKVFDKETTRFFVNVVEDTAKFREINNCVRKDLLQLLLDSNRLTIEEITAHVFIFFAGGFETSSITLAYCLYELAQKLEIQERIRNEINQSLLGEGKKITYNSIMSMKYMDQVVEETLRKYPAIPFITRACVQDYTIPGTKVVLEKGMEVLISILGLHRDPEYYPDPDNFDPERFSEENKRKRHPFTYIPFGGGPRICIGLRFGLMQVKVGLAMLLKNYIFSLNKQTDVPLKMDTLSFSLLPNSAILLDVEKIHNRES